MWWRPGSLKWTSLNLLMMLTCKASRLHCPWLDRIWGHFGLFLWSTSDLTMWFTLHVWRILRAARKEYIVAKYVERRFARRCSSTSAAKLHDLYNGVISRDIMTLLELYAYGMDFTESFPPMPGEVCHLTFVCRVSPFACASSKWDLEHKIPFPYRLQKFKIPPITKGCYQLLNNHHEDW